MLRCFFSVFTIFTTTCANAREFKPHTIGPYPASISDSSTGESVSLDTSAVFQPTYNQLLLRWGLKISVEIDLTNLKTLVTKSIRKRFPQDNCGRYGEDNWVWDIDGMPLQVLDRGRLLIRAEGRVQTWSCRPQLIDESVAEWGECSFAGVRYSCPVFRTRRSSPVKNLLLNEPVKAEVELRIRRHNDNHIVIYDSSPRLTCTGNTPVSALCNFLYGLTSHLGGILGEFARSQGPGFQITQLTRPLSASFEETEFYTDQGRAKMRLSASVGLSLGMLNDIMAAKFANEWKLIQDNNGRGNTPPPRISGPLGR